MSDNSFQGLQQSKAMPKSTVASKKAGRTTRWGCLGITCLLHGARLMSPPQEGTAFLLRALPSHHLPWQLCSTSSPPPTVPVNPFFLSGAAFWAPSPSPSSSSAKPAHAAPDALPIQAGLLKEEYYLQEAGCLKKPSLLVIREIETTEHRRDAIPRLNLSEESGCQIWALLMRVFKNQWEGLQCSQGQTHPRERSLAPFLAVAEEEAQRMLPGFATVCRALRVQ